MPWIAHSLTYVSSSSGNLDFNDLKVLHSEDGFWYFAFVYRYTLTIHWYVHTVFMCTNFSRLRQYFRLSKCPCASSFHIINFNWKLMISTAIVIRCQRKWTHVFVYKQHAPWYYANFTRNNTDSFFTLCTQCTPNCSYLCIYVAPTNMKHWRIVFFMIWLYRLIMSSVTLDMSLSHSSLCVSPVSLFNMRTLNHSV